MNNKCPIQNNRCFLLASAVAVAVAVAAMAVAVAVADVAAVWLVGLGGLADTKHVY